MLKTFTTKNFMNFLCLTLIEPNAKTSKFKKGEDPSVMQKILYPTKKRIKLSKHLKRPQKKIKKKSMKTLTSKIKRSFVKLPKLK